MSKSMPVGGLVTLHYSGTGIKYFENTVNLSLNLIFGEKCEECKSGLEFNGFEN